MDATNEKHNGMTLVRTLSPYLTIQLSVQTSKVSRLWTYQNASKLVKKFVTVKNSNITRTILVYSFQKQRIENENKNLKVVSPHHRGNQRHNAMKFIRHE